MTENSINQLLVDACMKHRVKFHWTGLLMIQLTGIETVLGELPADVRILGFDTFTLCGYETRPRLDYYSEYGEGIPSSEALANIAGWPRNMELWVEVVAKFEGEVIQ